MKYKKGLRIVKKRVVPKDSEGRKLRGKRVKSWESLVECPTKILEKENDERISKSI